MFPISIYFIVIYHKNDRIKLIMVNGRKFMVNGRKTIQKPPKNIKYLIQTRIYDWGMLRYHCKGVYTAAREGIALNELD